jgi:hypothetical protein
MASRTILQALRSHDGSNTQVGTCTSTPGSTTGTLDYMFDENTKATMKASVPARRLYSPVCDRYWNICFAIVAGYGMVAAKKNRKQIPNGQRLSR